MRRPDPPRGATWVLQHLAGGEHNDALAGDLLEEFRAGRSAVWYWRQVLAAALISWGKESLSHLDAFIFAVAWAVLAPAWVWEWMIHMYHSPNLTASIWDLPWPWSTICHFALNNSVDLVFVWTGLLLFVLMKSGIAGRPAHWRHWRGILSSALAYLATRAATLMVLFLPSYSHPVDWRTVKPFSRIADFTPGSCIERLPFFVATLVAIWGISRVRKSSRLSVGS